MRGTRLKWFKRRLNFVSCALHCLPRRKPTVIIARTTKLPLNCQDTACTCKLTQVVAGTLSTAAIPGIPIIADLAGKEGLFS